MIIAIVGKIGTGKTTAAKWLVKNNFKEEMFAAPIKEFCKIIGFTHKEIYGHQKDKLKPNAYWGVSFREFAQKFGTEIMRGALPEEIPKMTSIWVQTMEKKITESKENIVISDCRFPDEVAMVKKNNGIIIKLERNTCYDDSHQSESQIDSLEADYVFDNNGSLEDLHNFLKKIIS